MYCQTCGAEIQPGLNYCNRCGAQVSALAPREPADLTSPVRWLAATIILTLIFGSGMLIMLLFALAKIGVRGEPLTAAAVFGLAAVFGTEFMLVRTLSRLLLSPRGEGRRFGAGGRGKKELPNAAPAQLFQPPAAYTDPLPSVTEHTTRTLEQAYRAQHAER